MTTTNFTTFFLILVLLVLIATTTNTKPTTPTVALSFVVDGFVPTTIYTSRSGTHRPKSVPVPPSEIPIATSCFHHHHHRYRPETPTKTTTAVAALPDDWLEGIQRFWNSINPTSSNTENINNNINAVNGDDDDDLELPAGTSRLISIPVKQLKPGGLRLFLMFCLMGLQNTPSKNTWYPHQPIASSTGSRFIEATTTTGDSDNDDDSTSSPRLTTEIVNINPDDETEEYILEMIHHDRTGTITIELIPPPSSSTTTLDDDISSVTESNNNNKNDDDYDATTIEEAGTGAPSTPSTSTTSAKTESFGEVRILRSGSNPSNLYLMNESMVLDGILDELHKCAYDETIPEINRLIVPVMADAIDTARDELAFR